MIKIQTDDFSQDELFNQIQLEAGKNVGAISTFTGLVREIDRSDQVKLTALSLEHYPGMTENALIEISEKAKRRFELSAVIIIHRVGKLVVGENIVYVATASSHRKSAFEVAPSPKWVSIAFL